MPERPASNSADDAKDAETIAAIDADLPRIRAEAKEAAQRFESEVVRYLCKVGLLNLSEVMADLAKARAAGRASLEDVSQATALSATLLADLEAGDLVNATLPLLQRYAAAVGARLEITVADNGESGNRDRSLRR